MQNPKQKKKKRYLTFQKLFFLYSSLTILPQNQPQKNLCRAAIAKSNQEYKTKSQLLCRFDIKNSSTDHKYLISIITLKRQLHKLLSTQEEHSLTNCFSIVFCFRQSEARSITSSTQRFPSHSFSSHNFSYRAQLVAHWSHCQFSECEGPFNFGMRLKHSESSLLNSHEPLHRNSTLFIKERKRAI